MTSFFFQAEDGIRDSVASRGLGDVYKRQLVIRTSGETRLSNFMLWQSAYSEIHFTETLWPNFAEQEFLEIIQNYSQSDRRFGNVDEDLDLKKA